jgi:hypothetical protein
MGGHELARNTHDLSDTAEQKTHKPEKGDE